MTEGSKFYGARASSAPPSSWTGFPISETFPQSLLLCKKEPSSPHQPLVASLCPPGWGMWGGKAKGQGSGSDEVKFRREPARLEFLLILGVTWGGQDTVHSCFSCLYVPLSQSNSCTWLSAITMPLESCSGSNERFKLEQPVVCPGARQPQ